MYSSLTFEDDSSNLADVILFASFRINQKQATNQTERVVFIITDGYAAAPSKLKMSLSYAESLGIQTIAVGAGNFNDAIFEYFPNYVVVSDPHRLPGGLRKLFTGAGTADIPDSAMYMIQEERSIEHKGKTYTEIDEIWKEVMEPIFQEQISATRKALYLAIKPAAVKCNAISVDLCFVLDSTKSMKEYITNAKSYIREIVRHTKDNVSRICGKTTDVRLGFVSYKSKGDKGHLLCQPFTDDVKVVEEMLDSVQATGGRIVRPKDIIQTLKENQRKWGFEDKYDGIKKAMSFKWEGAIKFMVLIADVPGNQDKEADMPKLVAEIACNHIHLMFVSITDSTDKEREMFKESYHKAAPESMQEKGFVELDICARGFTNYTTNLEDLIMQRIDDIISSEFM